MKKQYIFLVMLLIILYISYLIVSFSYRDYKINSHIELISSINNDIKNKIINAEKIIKYKSSLAYKNKILKEQQSFKNKGEKVVYLTTEKTYNKFTADIVKPIKSEVTESIEENIINNLSIIEKWKKFIIEKKD